MLLCLIKLGNIPRCTEAPCSRYETATQGPLADAGVVY